MPYWKNKIWLCDFKISNTTNWYSNWIDGLNPHYVTYVFQSESTLYSCQNAKELLARIRSDIWSLSDYNGIWTHNHLVPKRTLNHLAKFA